MEINVKRMSEYNTYNIGVINALRTHNVIGDKEALKALKAVEILDKLYAQVSTMTITQGGITTKVVGLTNDNTHRWA
jgi:hypothetical protein